MSDFETWWKTPSIKAKVTDAENRYTPASIAMANRKEAAQYAYVEGGKVANGKLALAIEALETAYHYFDCERDSSGKRVTSEALKKLKA